MLKVITYSIASVDGRIAGTKNTRLEDLKWNALPKHELNLNWWIIEENKVDAVLEGSGSFVADGTGPFSYDHTYSLEDLFQDYIPEEIIQKHDRVGWFVVTDSRGRIQWKSKELPGEEWKGWNILILVSDITPPQYLAYLRDEKIPYIISGDSQVDFKSAFSVLNEKLGIQRIVSQGGGQLNGALLRQGIVSEVNVLLVPSLIGGTDTPSLFDSPELTENEWPVKLVLISSQIFENNFVWLKYQVDGIYTLQ